MPREKGRYRYAGQWKHGRMHGCGVYEVNERILYVGAWIRQSLCVTLKNSSQSLPYFAICVKWT